MNAYRSFFEEASKKNRPEVYLALVEGVVRVLDEPPSPGHLFLHNIALRGQCETLRSFFDLYPTKRLAPDDRTRLASAAKKAARHNRPRATKIVLENIESVPDRIVKRAHENLMQYGPLPEDVKGYFAAYNV